MRVKCLPKDESIDLSLAGWTHRQGIAWAQGKKLIRRVEDSSEYF